MSGLGNAAAAGTRPHGRSSGQDAAGSINLTIMHDIAASLMDHPTLAALVALKPKSYIIRLLIAGGAFAGAMNGEKVVGRVIGFVWLLIAGAGFLIVGMREGTVVDILLGLILGCAALYSWWHTHS